MQPRDCSGLLGRTSLRLDAAHGAFPQDHALFRPSRPDFIETSPKPAPGTSKPAQLFRPSRPDFIETTNPRTWMVTLSSDCSGLLGRTSLRLVYSVALPYRSKRHCSGLLGRTSLRQIYATPPRGSGTYCSGLLGRTSLRPPLVWDGLSSPAALFRPSRSDFIETFICVALFFRACDHIVPAF